MGKKSATIKIEKELHVVREKKERKRKKRKEEKTYH